MDYKIVKELVSYSALDKEYRYQVIVEIEEHHIEYRMTYDRRYVDDLIPRNTPEKDKPLVTRVVCRNLFKTKYDRVVEVVSQMAPEDDVYPMEPLVRKMPSCS